MVWNISASVRDLTSALVSGLPAALKAALLGARQTTSGKLSRVAERLVRVREVWREERPLMSKVPVQEMGRVRKLYVYGKGPDVRRCHLCRTMQSKGLRRRRYLPIYTD